MFDGPSPEPEVVVQTRWEIVSDVSLNGHNDAQLLEQYVGDWVGIKESRRGCCEDPHTDQFPRVEVLGDPRIWCVVLVVDRVDMFVQESHFVVGGMPDEVFQVKNHEGEGVLPENFPKTWGETGEVHRPVKYPLEDRDRQDVQDL